MTTYNCTLAVYDMGGEVVRESLDIPTLGDALQLASNWIGDTLLTDYAGDDGNGGVLDTWSIVDVTEAAGVIFEAQFTFTVNPDLDRELSYSTDYILQVVESND